MKPIFKFSATKLKKETCEKVFEFAQTVTSNLADKNKQRDMTSDNFEVNYKKYALSKLAEYAVCAWLLVTGITCTPPDLNIYKSGDKGHDLQCTGKTGVYRVHVKYHTIDSEKKFGKAWQFAKDDPLTFAPKRNDLIVLMSPNSGETFFTFDCVKIVKATDMILSYVQPYNAYGYPIRKKWKLDYQDVRFERDFKIV